MIILYCIIYDLLIDEDDGHRGNGFSFNSGAGQKTFAFPQTIFSRLPNLTTSRFHFRFSHPPQIMNIESPARVFTSVYNNRRRNRIHPLTHHERSDIETEQVNSDIKDKEKLDENKFRE